LTGGKTMVLIGLSLLTANCLPCDSRPGSIGLTIDAPSNAGSSPKARPDVEVPIGHLPGYEDEKAKANARRECPPLGEHDAPRESDKHPSR
jgi:hypothetical protein